MSPPSPDDFDEDRRMLLPDLVPEKPAAPTRDPSLEELARQIDDAINLYDRVRGRDFNMNFSLVIAGNRDRIDVGAFPSLHRCLKETLSAIRGRLGRVLAEQEADLQKKEQDRRKAAERVEETRALLADSLGNPAPPVARAPDDALIQAVNKTLEDL